MDNKLIVVNEDDLRELERDANRSIERITTVQVETDKLVRSIIEEHRPELLEPTVYNEVIDYIRKELKSDSEDYMNNIISDIISDY